MTLQETLRQIAGSLKLRVGFLKDAEADDLAEEVAGTVRVGNYLADQAIKAAARIDALEARAAPRVKALEWSRGMPGLSRERWYAGNYCVIRDKDDKWILEVYRTGAHALGLYNTREEAQAAGQEHHNNAILSALEPS